MEGLGQTVFQKISDHETRISILENDRKITKGVLIYIGTLSTVILGAILVHFGW